MALLIDLIIMIGLLVILFNLSVNHLFPSWAGFVGVIVFCIALFFRVSTRLFKGLYGGSFVRLAFTIGMPILSTVALITRLSADYPSTNAAQLFMLLLPVYIIILGIYIMVWGAFTSPTGIIWNIPVMISLVTFFISVMLRGILPIEVGIIFLVILLLLLGTGNLRSVNKKRVKNSFTVLLIITGLIIVFFFDEQSSHLIMPLVALIICFILLVNIFGRGFKNKQQ